jgi:hypothetical protein
MGLAEKKMPFDPIFSQSICRLQSTDKPSALGEKQSMQQLPMQTGSPTICSELQHFCGFGNTPRVELGENKHFLC